MAAAPHLGGTGNHVLDEIAMAGGVNDRVVVLVGEELLGGAGDGDTTLALLLLPVHVEGEGEGLLAESLGLGLQLVHLTLGDTAQLEEQAPGGGGLAGVDMSADDDGKMGLAVSHCVELVEGEVVERNGALGGENVERGESVAAVRPKSGVRGRRLPGPRGSLAQPWTRARAKGSKHQLKYTLILAPPPPPLPFSHAIYNVSVEDFPPRDESRRMVLTSFLKIAENVRAIIFITKTWRIMLVVDTS